MEVIAATTKGRSRRGRYWVAALSVVAIAAAATATVWWLPRGSQRAAPQSPPVPVTVTKVIRRDVPIFLDGLGTVQASNTVAIRSQIDGKLQTVKFTEGQEVHQGDTIAVIDPRPLQAALDQAIAKKAQDQAQLTGAQKDLARFQTLGNKGYETQQNIDQQQAKVDQFKAAIAADQASIENAQVQLSYTNITAPIDGRVGFRQVDAGNIVHANDPNPLTVLTQLRPAVATFTLPQKDLAGVREAMLRGGVSVLAFDQDNAHQLAQGELILIDNQIDQTTSTIELKARFANTDEELWPGEFVHLHLQVDTHKDAVTIPPAAVQRGSQGVYAWIVQDDGTAAQRPIETITVNNELTIVTKGLSAGERVVVGGQYRLQAGAQTDAKTEQAAKTPDKSS